jgi:polysaccharide pyruvyl transferase WcaK-like protein
LVQSLSKQGAPLVGLNVSGLLFNSDDGGKSHYGLKGDYRQIVIDLTRRLVDEGCRVVLIPHVVTPPGHFESDIAACEAVAAHLNDSDCVTALPALADARQIKWVISQMDWFCGTRMHSTIAALSSGVPTAAIAYSLKTAGVFESCGQEPCVIDPRKLETAAAVEMLWSCWQSREEARSLLQQRLAAVMTTASTQMRAIIQAVTRTAALSAMQRTA